MRTKILKWVLVFSLLLNIYLLGFIYTNHKKEIIIINGDIEKFINNHRVVMLEMNNILSLSSIYTENGELDYTFVNHLRKADNHLMANDDIYDNVIPYIPDKLKNLNEDGLLLIDNIWNNSINGEYEKVSMQIKRYSEIQLELSEKIQQNGLFRKKPINKSPKEIEQILDRIANEIKL